MKIECPNCSRKYSSESAQCPACGWDPESVKKAEETEGVEVQQAPEETWEAGQSDHAETLDENMEYAEGVES